MPIRDLTERPQIPRLGKIRLGVFDEGKNRPVNLEHFVVPPEVAAVYGDNPTKLEIVFLSDDLETIASQYYRAYNKANGLVCKGDGFTANALLDADVLRKRDGDLTQPFPTLDLWAHGSTSGREKGTENTVKARIECLGAGYGDKPPCPMFAAKKCAVRNFMQFAVRDVPGLGVYQLDTGSVVNTRQVNGVIELCKQTVGGVAGVPMTLERKQLEVAPNGRKSKVWGLELRVATDLSLTRLLEYHESGPRMALLPPVDETEVYEHPGDGDETDQDFSARPVVVEGQVLKREEAPAAPAPVMVTDEQKKRLGKLAAELNTWDKDSKSKAYDHLRTSWPHAFTPNGNYVNKLTLEEADAVIRYLMPEGEPPPAGQPAMPL